jgi:uncharacterized membrane protein
MKPSWNTTFFLLPVIGLVAAILGYMDFKSGGSLCPSGIDVLDCSRVYVIPQARILGVHLSEAAPAYFLALSISAILNLAYRRRESLIAYLALSIVGLSIVPYLIYLELMVARALCLYCTVMHVAIVGCSIHSTILWTRS